MSTVLRIIWFLSFLAVLPSVIATPSDAANPSTLRYTAGDDLGAIVKSMKYDENGVFAVGPDGVLRTFANDLTVVDYRQLDADQVKLYATLQISQWTANGMDFPSSLTQMMESPVDGRLTTDVDSLLRPTEKPNVPVLADVQSRAIDPIEMAGLVTRATLCPGNPACQTVSDCFQYRCYACAYLYGPPFGTCFVS